MSGGAAGTHARAEADEQTSDDQQRPGRRNDHLWGCSEDDEIGQRTEKKAGDEGDVMTQALAAMAKQPADDTADPGDVTVEQHEKTGRQADQRAAAQGSEIGVRHQTAPSSTSSGIFR